MSRTADKIKALMAKRGLSSYQLALDAHISPSSLSRYFSGVVDEPRISTLVRIADVLQVPIEELADIPTNAVVPDAAALRAARTRADDPAPSCPEVRLMKSMDIATMMDMGIISDNVQKVRMPFFPRFDEDDRRSIVAMRITDESMSPYYLPGDVVFFGTKGLDDIPYCGPNYFVACIHNGRCVVRKAENGDGEDIWYSTLNPDWKGLKTTKDATFLGAILCSVRGMPE